MIHEVSESLKTTPLPVSRETVMPRPCGATPQQVSEQRGAYRTIALRNSVFVPFTPGAPSAQGLSGCENLSRKEVRKVYLECVNCFERVEPERAADFVRKIFNNGSVEFSVACPVCGYGNRIIDVPSDDYAFSGEVFDLSEALNDHDLELLARYEQGMRLS